MDDLKIEYERGRADGEIHSLENAVGRAHKRIDKHDIRLSSLEKVMYAGMGVVVILQTYPHIITSAAGQ
jgi:cell division protein FtsL